MAGERSLGSLVYWFRAKNEELKRKSKESGQAIRDMAEEFDKSKRTIKSWSADVKSSIKQVSDFAKQHKEAIQAVAVGTGAALAGLVLKVKKATKEHVEFTNAMIGLRSIAEGTGQDLDKTTKAAEELASDGLMSVADAATGLKNLLLAGFGLDEAIVLMERFKDSAAFGRQGALSFGEAIRSATEGIRQGNSILVDNAGVTKNLSVMLQEAGYSAQDLGRAADDAGVRMAIFNGIIRETRHQVGDAAKLAHELGGAQSRVEESTKRLHRAIGAATEGPIRDYLTALDKIINRIADWIEDHQELTATIIFGLGGVLAAMLSLSTGLLLLDKFVKVLRLIRTLAMENTLAFAFRAWVGGAASATEAVGFLFAAFKPFLVGGAVIAGLTLIVKRFRDIQKEAKLAAKDIKTVNDVSELQELAKFWDEEIKRLEESRRRLEEDIRKRKSGALRGPNIPGTPMLGISAHSISDEELLQWDKEKLEKLNQSIDEAIQKRREIQKKLDELLRPETTPRTESDSTPKFNLDRFIEQLKAELDMIDQIAATFEDYSDVATDKANVLRNAIIELVREGIDPTSTSLGNLVELYNQYADAAEKAKNKTYNLVEAKEELEKALEDVDKKAAIFGDEIDVNAEKLVLLKGAIIEALTNGIDPLDASIQDLIAEYNALNQVVDETNEAIERQEKSTSLLARANQELINWQNRNLSSLQILANQLEAQAALDEKNRDKLLEMAQAMRDLAEEQEKVTTAEQNNKEATELLAQAQEYLYRMTGKLAPEWEQFAQKLEEMAGKDGVLPEVAAQLREIADQIRGVGAEMEPKSNWFTDVFENIGYKIEEAHNIFKNFRDGLVDGFTDIITKGREVEDVFKQILDYLAEMIIKRGVVEPIVDWVLSGIGLGSAHIGALVTPAGLVHDLPSFHSGGVVPGHRSDERIIKVLTGERILSREQNKKFEAGEYGKTEVTNVFNINAVDAASFAQLVRRNPEAITSVVAGDIVSDGPLRKTIMRYTK